MYIDREEGPVALSSKLSFCFGFLSLGVTATVLWLFRPLGGIDSGYRAVGGFGII